MKLLALETSSDACSCALLVGGTRWTRHEVAPRRHGELILPMVQELLAEAGETLRALDAIAFGCGPGAFTGVRIAAAIAQGLAFGADRPIVAVSSLQALAQGAARELGLQRVLAAVDARMDEVYVGAYRCGAHGLMEAIGTERVCAPQAVPVPADARWAGVGSGFERYLDSLRGVLGGRLGAVYPRYLPQALDVAFLAEQMLQQGAGVEPAAALPVYVRDRVVNPRGRPGGG